MMREWEEIVEAAADTEPHHGLTLKSGRYLEGYILEFGSDWLEFGEGGPLVNYDTSLKLHQSEIELIWFSVDGKYVAHKVGA